MKRSRHFKTQPGKKEFFFPAIMSIFFGCLTLFMANTRSQIESEEDLITISDKYINHSFESKRGNRTTRHTYYLWLWNFDSPFQIRADNITKELKPNFEETVKFGDLLTLKIYKGDKSKLNTDNKIPVYHVQHKNKLFLTSKNAIEKHNNPVFWYSGIGLITLGGILFLFWMRNRKKWN